MHQIQLAFATNVTQQQGTSPHVMEISAVALIRKNFTKFHQRQLSRSAGE